MKKLLFWGAYLVALGASPVMAQTHKTEVVNDEVRAQTGGAEVVVMRLNSDRGYALLTRPDGKTEEIKLNLFTTKNGLTESSTQLQQAFASLYQQGYALKSTFVTHTSITTLVFVKEK